MLGYIIGACAVMQIGGRYFRSYDNRHGEMSPYYELTPPAVAVVGLIIPWIARLRERKKILRSN
jgi:hypothetical protein